MPTARRITENRIVPRMASSRVFSAAQWHSVFRMQQDVPALSVRIPRKPTAVPNAAHKNTGVTVMTAVICRNAVMMPTMRLATTAAMVQLHLQLHMVMILTSMTTYDTIQEKVKHKGIFPMDY